MSNVYLIKQAVAWVKRKNGHDKVIRVVPDIENEGGILCYNLYVAYEEEPEYLGRILFDTQGYWIYDGDFLSIAEQVQLAKFISNQVRQQLI